MNLIGLGILLGLLGGLIAYFADRLGRTLGKKRLSLFKLRPRHTAELLTVGAGALIPLVTLALAMAFNAEVRQWLAEGPKLLAERDKAVKDVSSLNKERDQKTKDIDSINKRFNESQERLRLSEARIRVSNAKLTNLEGQLRKLSASYQQVAQRLHTASGDLLSVRKEYGALERTYRALDESYKRLHEEQKAAYVENLKLVRENEGVQRANAEGKQENALLQKEKQRLQNDLASARSDLERTLINLDEARVMAEQSRSAFSQEFFQGRLSPLIYSFGEEVARIDVAPGLPKDAARSMLDALLHRSIRAAADRGAKPTNNGIPEASIPPFKTTGRSVTTDEQEEAVVHQLTNAPQSLVVVANSTFNTFAGESVCLSIRAHPNPVVYKHGQTIAETRINGRLSEYEVLQQITEFLSNNVSAQAKKVNMVLVVSTREPAMAVTMPELLELVKAIRLTGRTVKLIAQADGDIRAAGPLKLQFHVI